ncbi:MAG TPA: F0F1 ATP synthase subunit A [Chthoniobacteraceae bacterium]|nr:F0F1 ATP synthase subunit A [Chthoniobacteraceae bacterium]
MSIQAEPITESVHWLTNSILVTAIVTGIILFLARRATAKMKLVPDAGVQNIFELVVESLYDMLEGIVGKHMIKRTFPLLATIFIFILASNWFGLVPGVGTIGFGKITGPFHSIEMQHPLLRPANADLNMTLAMAALFTVIWIWWTFTETGPIKFLKHTFLPKGDLSGMLWLFLLPIFMFVGVIEVVSIGFRVVSLSLRLFGNIFSGENLMHTMGNLGDALPAPLAYLSSVLLPLPFFFLELLVGFIQALVFMLLCAAYIQLSTSHDEEEHEH